MSISAYLKCVSVFVRRLYWSWISSRAGDLLLPTSPCNVLTWLSRKRARLSALGWSRFYMVYLIAWAVVFLHGRIDNVVESWSHNLTNWMQIKLGSKQTISLIILDLNSNFLLKIYNRGVTLIIFSNRVIWWSVVWITTVGKIYFNFNMFFEKGNSIHDWQWVHL